VLGLDDAKLSIALDSIYEAALRPEMWRTALHHYSHAVGGDAALILPGPGSPLAPVCSETFDEAVSTGIEGGWFARNPRVERGMRAMRGAQDVLTEERIFAYEEVDRNPWYADYVHRCGFGWFAGTYLVPDGRSSIMISVERRRERGVFTRDEAADLARFVPHLQRAGQLAARAAEARASGIVDGLDALNCGGALIDGLGRLVRLNAQAERHIGRGLRVVGTQLCAMSREGDAVLQRLVRSMLYGDRLHTAVSAGPAVLPRPDRNPLLVHAAPVVGTAHDIFNGAKLVLMVIDPDEGREPAEPVLKQAFGLTSAEVRVSLALLHGQDISEAAGTAQVSEGTVRAQLKSVFAKTGTHRQSDLVSLLLRLSGR
jgi:DNA-binding CsgD family transcriptional regulator